MPVREEELSPPREQASFMDKVKAYRARKRGSKGGELSSSDGPLGQGLSQQAAADARPERDPRYNEGLQEFFAEVAEAKVGLSNEASASNRVSVGSQRRGTGGQIGT